MPRLPVPMFLPMTLCLALGACQKDTSPRPPEEVRAAVVRQFAEVGVTASQVDQAAGLFKPVKLTALAAPEWLVDFSRLPSGQMCGTGGCPVQVWVKNGSSPYTLAFDRQTLGQKIMHDEQSGQRWLSVELHGVLCGGTGSDDCQYNFAWQDGNNAGEGYFAAASIKGKPARYVGPLVQAMPLAAPKGSPLEQILQDYRKACAAAGGKAAFDDALTRLPDLNHDGRPELLFEPASAECQSEGDTVEINCDGKSCPNLLFSEKGEAGWRMVWKGKPFAYAIDFSQPEARLFSHPADCEENCPEQLLVWQDDKQRFAHQAPLTRKPAPQAKAKR